ncbi:WD40 repeat domain-containing serine/threonine protein kinase [Nonomuraea sp. CA-143628]|uniref:WD40 repeat domain-containing serine/threonine protein kinase n=1 Tax=Nonomuraea sp. CA-143628 TaxID=3239997 RepID=UPI003D8B635A
MALHPGDPRQLGKYWLAGRLGAGGQGVVYEAYDETNRRVAIKALRVEWLEQGDMRLRFINEVVAAQRVSPFCTARIIEADLDGSQPYIVSEYVDGPSLQRAVDLGGPYSAEHLYRLGVGIATALTAIHEARVVHRDLKPANVMLGPDGPRVIDFGIARTDDKTLTTEGRFAAGSPPYMAPERLDGRRGGFAVDVWAWGAVMMFAATGRAPYPGDDFGVVRYHIQTTRPAFEVLTEPLRSLVTAAMALDPAARPDVRALLLGLIGGRGDTARLLRDGSQAAESIRPPASLTGPSLGDQAERVYAGLGPEDQAIVPPILLRMVLPDEGAEGAVRQARLDDLLDGEIDRTAVERVLRAFEDEALLVRQNDSVGLVSAALLRAWPRLRAWVAADPDGLRVHSLLNETARLWHVNQRRPDDLYQGTNLATARQWERTSRGQIKLNLLEATFLRESVARSRVKVRRRRSVLGAVAVLAALTVMAVSLAFWLNIRGERQRDAATAERAAERAEALRADDPLSARLLSVAAWQTSPVTKAKAALHNSLAHREVRVVRAPQAGRDAMYDLSDDGRTEVVADRGTATLREVATGRSIRQVAGISTPARAIALSSDGRRLAVAGQRSVELWDAERGVKIGDFGTATQYVAFNANRLLLATITVDGQGQVWDLTTLRRLPLRASQVSRLVISDDGGLMAAVTINGRYGLWNWQGRVSEPRGDDLAFAPQGRTLAVRTGDETRVRDLSRNRWQGLAMPSGRTESMRFSPDSRYLATYDGRNVSLWLPGRSTPMLRYPVPHLTRGLRFGPENRTLSYLLPGGAVATLDIADLTMPAPLVTGAEAAVFSPDARLLAVQRRSDVELWEVASRERVLRLRKVVTEPAAMAFSRDGGRLAVGSSSDPALVTLWEVPSGRRTARLKITKADEVEGLVFSPDGRTLVVASRASEVGALKAQVWDLTTNKRVGGLGRAGGSGMAFSPDGRALAINGPDGAVVDMAVRNAAPRPFGASSSSVRAITYSADGAILATGFAVVGLDLWDARSLAKLGHLPLADEKDEQVDVVDFARDGKTVAAAGAGGKVWLWDVAERSPLGEPLTLHDGFVLALTFSPDGSRLLSFGTDGTLREHPIAPERLISAVCAKTKGGTLSKADWESSFPGRTYRNVC